jgi:DNA-binding MarR family transcriptional regulator
MSEDSRDFDITPLIMAAARTQLGAMMARLSELGFEGLTPAFASVMPLLDAKGSRSTVLAQRAGVTKQAMSQLVKLLEQRNYVEQAPDPIDTRAKVVRLTKRGVALRKACDEIRRDLNAAAVKAVGKRDIIRLHEDLNKLIAAMKGPLNPQS